MQLHNNPSGGADPPPRRGAFEPLKLKTPAVARARPKTKTQSSYYAI